jgi:hypothetical protein
MTDELNGTGVWSGLKIKREPPKEEDEEESKEEATPAATTPAKKLETNTKQK